MSETKKRGLAMVDPERRSEISSMGGIAGHQQGTAHEFSRDEARSAGSKGGKMRGVNARLLVRISELEKELALYRAFYEMAADMDLTGEMTDYSNFGTEDAETWAENTVLIERIEALRKGIAHE